MPKLISETTLNGLEDVLKGPRYDTTFVHINFVALHCVRLACSGLSVSEYGSVVPFQHALDDRQCSMLEYELLFAARLKDHIKREDLIAFTLFV